MLAHIPFPLLPAPPSWYPGHMARFVRMLPALLQRTDVVLELRDSRLPLTSVNKDLEGALLKWQTDKSPARHSMVCERIVVFTKRDLVPAWGIEPFRAAMAAKFPDQKTFFAAVNHRRDVKTLSDLLVNTARQHSYAPELNVLVVGMPNVGKSTLLNALRNIGIAGPTPKALRTAPEPGVTRTLSTRLKLSQDPLVYSYDSPGVMLPFLGRGDKGAERGVKLALIAGIKEGLYDVEALASYLLYRLNILDPIGPAYLKLLPPGSQPTTEITDFLDQLAQRLGMLKGRAVRDIPRAAAWFVRWWRQEGGLASSAAPLRASAPGAPPRAGWGFDFEWENDSPGSLQQKMEECVDVHIRAMEQEDSVGGVLSLTQERKIDKQEKIAARIAKSKARFVAKRL